MGRNAWRSAMVAVALLASVAGCIRQGPGASTVPAPAGVGGLIGVNPDVPSAPGARISKVPYGPFTVPAARGTAHGQEGMIKNAFRFGVAKPCNNCYITGVHASLAYPDGRTANIDTGLWLHHMVLFEMGKTDPTCPATGVGLIGQRFFASGNERTRVRSPGGYGLQTGANGWVLIYDLMNSNPQPANVSIEMTFEWLPLSTPGMKAVTPVWLDVNQCLTSEVPARTGSYSYTYTWPATFSGKLLGAGGHVHDGGTHLTITNTGRAASPRNELLCNSVAMYDSAGGMDHGGDGHEHDMGGDQYISGMTQCVAADADQPVATVTQGDRIKVDAYYNTNLRPLHGSHPVMGIAIAYFATS